MPEQEVQPVPTNQTTTKTSSNSKKLVLLAGAGLIVLLLILIYLFRGQIGDYLKGAPKGPTIDNPVKPGTPSAKEATKSAIKDKTIDELDFLESSGWKNYSNAKIGYSLKYPPGWLTRECTDGPDFFAPKKELLGVCNSGFGGLVGISKITGTTLNEMVANYAASDYDNFKKETSVVGGKVATKISGTSKVMNEMVDERGTKRIVYLVDLGAEGIISINYSQSKSWSDYSKEFEQMISTFKFL